MPPDPAIALLCRVTGRVQGVWFRGWTQATATRLGLDGWVRNEPDGSVRALLSGPGDRVREMVAALHAGPESARVAAVTTEPAEPPAQPGFHVLR
jgi:acylphosphatase